MPSRLIFQACCPETHFPLCVPCFRLLTTWEHLLCLGLSYFSHQLNPSSPTWTQNTHNTLSTAELLQETLGDIYKDLWDEVECVTKPSIFFAPRHQLRNPWTRWGICLHTYTDTLKHSRCGAPEDKACVTHFCQYSIQPGWWVPITTLILEAGYDFGPNPSSVSEHISCPLCHGEARL